MPDDDPYDDQDEGRPEAWLGAFDDPPPRDVAPSSGLTRAALERMSDAVGKPGRGLLPGELLEDVDGQPLGVTGSRPVATVFGGAVIFESDARRLNVQPGELPGIKIMPDPQPRES